MVDLEKPSRLRIWITAVRPFAYTASALPVVLGAVLAWHAGFPFQWGRFLLTLLGVICFHTAANLFNDCFDFRRGLDTQVNPASGAVVRGWLTDRQVARAAFLCFVVGTACGLVLAWLAGWPVLALGVAGGFLVLGYTRLGFCLKYAGLGDLAIVLAFGVLPVLGAFFVQAEQVAWSPVFWSVPMVAYTVGILHANNWRDISTDSEKQCRTLAVKMGSDASRLYYRAQMLGPFVLVIAYLLLARVSAVPIRAPLTTLAVFLALPAAMKLAWRGWRLYPDEFAMLDARTAKVHTLFGILLTLGFILDRFW